jgi:hypothetical protein
MVPKSVLDHAKSFLCWDTFPDLTIQLIGLGETAAYFFPPSNDKSTVVVFYQKQAADFSRPLFLLFHEAGHLLQFQEWEKEGRAPDFQRITGESSGAIKTAFERESWNWGKDLFEDFIHAQKLDGGLIEAYETYAKTCIQSYG